MARRGKQRKPLTPTARKWMGISGLILTLAGAIIVMVLALILWNNWLALIFTAAVLFMFSGYPVLIAMRRARRQGKLQAVAPQATTQREMAPQG